MGLWKGLKASWYSLPAEAAKGTLKGQSIRITNPKRYRKLKSIRPDRPALVRQKNQLIGLLKDKLTSNGVPFVKVYGRVKTLGSLDRKERYSKKMFLETANEYMREDFVGITVLVKDKEDCYKVFDVLKGIGEFPDLGFRPNPRDYIAAAEAVRRPEVTAIRDAIIGNMVVKGFDYPVHIKAMTKEAKLREQLDKGAYKRRIKKASKVE